MPPLCFGTPGGDVEHSAELYHEDAVLEVPHSGERFEGRAGFTEWRSRYPAGLSAQPPSYSNFRQVPSETTSTPPSVTVIAELSSRT